MRVQTQAFHQDELSQNLERKEDVSQPQQARSS